MALLVFSFLMLALVGWFIFTLTMARKSTLWDNVSLATAIVGAVVLFIYIGLCFGWGNKYGDYFDTVKTCEKANTYIQAEQSTGVYVYNHHKIQNKTVKLVSKCNGELSKLKEYNKTFWYDYVIPDEVNDISPIVLKLDGKIKDPITFSLEALSKFLSGLVD